MFLLFPFPVCVSFVFEKKKKINKYLKFVAPV